MPGKLPPTKQSEPAPGDSVDSFIRDAVAATESLSNEGVPLLPLETGEVVGDRFRVEKRAGRGGMGAVYRSTDLTTGLPVAIKVIERQSPSVGERFAREAMVLADLSHPCIVRYVTHGVTSSGSPFLAMDWLDGEDLCERLARSPLPAPDCLLLMRRVCEGLSVAHGRGVVHRDIKPSNVFLPGGDPGAAKIIDFGVARLALGSTALTRPGTALGTAGYMAPEQAIEATDVDARADIFALGCVLFECLTGQAAFGGRPAMVLVKVLREHPPKPSELRPEVGQAFDTLVERMLAKDRSARPQNAAEVLEALDELG
jgi:eukaryotic-like serine/threonine-protein kinase